MIRTSGELTSEFVQSVQYEAKVLEVFAQSNIPRCEGIVDDKDIVTVQVIEKSMWSLMPITPVKSTKMKKSMLS